jgi:hypothetical protein
MPTYIYPNSIDFYKYAMNEYSEQYNPIVLNRSFEQCSSSDPECQALEIPLTNQENYTNSTCLDNPYTASGCCSLYTNAFFENSSSQIENDWRKFLIDLFSGTVSQNYH